MIKGHLTNFSPLRRWGKNGSDIKKERMNPEKNTQLTEEDIATNAESAEAAENAESAAAAEVTHDNSADPDLRTEKSEEEIEAEKERNQREFEKLTSEGFKRFSSLEKDVKIPKGLKDYSLTIKDKLEKQTGWGLATVLGFLLSAKDNRRAETILKADIPDMSVFEVGGFPFNLSKLFDANYTGIDLRGRDKITFSKHGKKIEQFKMDVFDFDERLENKSYDLIWGLNFFGVPIESHHANPLMIKPELRSKEISIIESLNTLLRPGGLMVFSQGLLESSDLSEKDIEKLGLKSAINQMDGSEIIVVRKPGLYEEVEEE